MRARSEPSAHPWHPARARLRRILLFFARMKYSASLLAILAGQTEKVSSSDLDPGRQQAIGDLMGVSGRTISNRLQKLKRLALEAAAEAGGAP